jgi:hypothetical protein
MDGTEDHYVELGKSSSESEKPHFHSYAESIPKIMMMMMMIIMGHECKRGTI